MRGWLRNFAAQFIPDNIEQLIDGKGCQRYRPGMEKPDPHILGRRGLQKWGEVMKAQRNLYVRHPFGQDGPRLVKFNGPRP